MVICNCVGNCNEVEDCLHSTPHDPGKCFIGPETENMCTTEDVCPSTGYVVKCIEVEEN
jgi:hypothetical protein